LPPPTPSLFPYTTLFRSHPRGLLPDPDRFSIAEKRFASTTGVRCGRKIVATPWVRNHAPVGATIPRRQRSCSGAAELTPRTGERDRKSTRLNSSHVKSSY